MSVVAETGSTNADLLAAARDGAPNGTVLVADHQTGGRGRHGRAWSAPPRSGLLCSILFRPGPAPVLAGATWAVGLAAREACRAVAGVDVDLKWPNDLMVGPRKLAGVLAETAIASGSVSAVVVGIGVNLRWTAPPPDDVRERAVTLSELAGRDIDRDALLGSFLAALAPLAGEWRDAPASLLGRYRAALGTLQAPVRVELDDHVLTGVATDVTDDGALVVAAGDGTVHVLHAGDVVHLRDHRSGGPPG